jgi:hypothetical protein
MDSDYPFGIFKLLLVKGLKENWWRLDFLETTNKIEPNIENDSTPNCQFYVDRISKMAITKDLLFSAKDPARKWMKYLSSKDLKIPKG